MKEKITKSRKAIILANKLQSLQPLSETVLTRSNWRKMQMRTAWAALELYDGRAKLVAVRKKDGTKDLRILLEDWCATHLVNGKGHSAPQGYTLFTDLAKLIAGKKDTVMFKDFRILG